MSLLHHFPRRVPRRRGQEHGYGVATSPNLTLTTVSHMRISLELPSHDVGVFVMVNMTIIHLEISYFFTIFTCKIGKCKFLALGLQYQRIGIL